MEACGALCHLGGASSPIPAIIRAVGDAPCTGVTTMDKVDLSRLLFVRTLLRRTVRSPSLHSQRSNRAGMSISLFPYSCFGQGPVDAHGFVYRERARERGT